MALILANVPMMFCAALGLLSVYLGHDGFGVAFVFLAFLLAHSVKSSDA